MKEFRIEGRHAGKRLDRFMEEMEHWPHGMVVKAIRMKKLKVNGKKEDRTYRLCEGDRVVSYVLPKEKRRDFTIVYEDEHILIADKKAGLLCMDSTGKTTRTLIGEVNEYLADKGEPSAYMVHRIDFNTSGLMVIAKDEESKGILDRMIKERELEKVYLCIVSGVPKKKEGHLTHYLFKDAKQGKVFLSDVPQKGAKSAVTAYHIVKTGQNLSLLECTLLTGRTHQIRSQMAYIGHPLIGDDKYGSKEVNRRYGEKGQLLHAWKITFHLKGSGHLLSYLDGQTFTTENVPFLKSYFPDGNKNFVIK